MSVASVNPVFVVGPLPPPVHGASVITRSVIALLKSAGASIVECDISPSVTVRGWKWHLSRMRAYGRTLRQIIAGRVGSVVYIALSGGNGLFYDLLAVLATRLRGHRLVLHHHSFDYVDRSRAVFSLLLRLAPKDHVHVVLCRDMGRKLSSRYRMDLDCVHVSNLCFFPPDAHAAKPRSALRKIGFLSNISRDKGIDRFLDVAERFVGDLEFHVAGPFADDATRIYVEQRFQRLPNVTCHGPLFGTQKQAFYDAIDLFVFLSRYSNEAEPLVIYEALAAGLPVVATARGCLCEMVDPAGAVLIDRNGDDLETVVRRVREWTETPAAYAMACAASREHLVRLHDQRDRHLREFLMIFDPRLSPISEQPMPAQKIA